MLIADGAKFDSQSLSVVILFFEKPFLLLFIFFYFSWTNSTVSSFSFSCSLNCSYCFSSSTGVTYSFVYSMSKSISSWGSKSYSMLASVWDVRMTWYYLCSFYSLKLYLGLAVLTRFWLFFCCAYTAKFVWRYTELVVFFGSMLSKFPGRFLNMEDFFRKNYPGIVFWVSSSSSDMMALPSYPVFVTFFNMNEAWWVFLSNMLDEELFIFEVFFSWVNLIEYLTSEALVYWSLIIVFEWSASESAHVWNVCVLLAYCLMAASLVSFEALLISVLQFILWYLVLRLRIYRLSFSIF